MKEAFKKHKKVVVFVAAITLVTVQHNQHVFLIIRKVARELLLV